MTYKRRTKLFCIFALATLFSFSCGDEKTAARVTVYCVDQYGTAIPGLEVKFADDNKTKTTEADGILVFQKYFSEDTPVFIEPQNHLKMGLEFLGPSQVYLRKGKPRQELFLNFYRSYEFEFTTKLKRLKNDSTLYALDDVKISTRAQRLGKTNKMGKLGEKPLRGFHPDSLEFIAQSGKSPVILVEGVLTAKLQDFAFDKFAYKIDFVFEEKKKKPKPKPKPKPIIAAASVTVNTGGLYHTVQGGGGDGDRRKRVHKLKLPGNKTHQLKIKMTGRKEGTFSFRAAAGGVYKVSYRNNFLTLYQMDGNKEKMIGKRVRVERE